MEVSVFIGKRCLKEYHHNGNVFICADLHSDNAFTIEEDDPPDSESDSPTPRKPDASKHTQHWQRYTLNPFRIQVKKIVTTPIFLVVKLDGEIIQSRPYGPGAKEIWVDRMKCGQELRELVFSLPRLTSKPTVSASRQMQLGSIEVVMEEAKRTGTQVVPATIYRGLPSSQIPATPWFPQATKKDVGRVASHGNRTVVGRDGRIVGYLSEDPGKTFMRDRLVRTNKVLCRKVVAYRSAEVLREMGLLPKSLTPPRPPLEVLNRNETDDMKQDVKLKVEAIQCQHLEEAKTSVAATLFPQDSSKPVPKVEEMEGKENMEEGELSASTSSDSEPNMDASVIYMGREDAAVKTEIDKSIIFMGDHDCHVIDRDLTIVDVDALLDMETDD